MSYEKIDDENAAARVSRRITERLHERGLTGRALAQQLKHGDGWISGIKGGKWSLGLDELDETADFLKLTPSELVRKDSNELWELRPTEQRIIRALRALPPVVRDHLMILAEYLVGVTPHEAEHLMRVHQLSEDDQERFWRGADVLWLTRHTVVPRTATHEIPPATSRPAARAVPAAQRMK